MSLESEYWRVREQTYRAIAVSCTNPRTRENWLALAKECEGRAAEIERARADPAAATGDAAPAAQSRSAVQKAPQGERSTAA